MSDQTTCPICHTVFRVAAVSLADSNGMVQCGVCGMVFDARLHATADDTIPSSPSLPADTEPELTAPHIDPVILLEETPSTLAVTLSESCDPSEHITEETQYSEKQAKINENVVANSAFPSANIQFTKKNVRKHAGLKISFVTVLLLLLVVQFFMVYRDQLSVNIPQLLPVLKTVCKVAHCQIKLPADKNLIKINNTSFEVDPKNPNLISVHIALENQSDTAIAFPNIALSLTNDDDEVLVRKNFKPKDYLSGLQTLNNGIGAHAEVAIKLTLAVSNLQATGYKLLVFY